MEHEDDSDTNCSCCTWNRGGLETKGRIKTIQTTALLKPSKILRRVQGIQTSMKNYCCEKQLNDKKSTSQGENKR